MNLPNKLTLLRIILVPVFIFFYLASFIPFNLLIALAIFIVAAVTDFLDGYIARKNNLVTNLGKFMDPIADKMLVFAGLFMLMQDNTLCGMLGANSMFIGAIVVFIILARDLMVDALRQIASTKNFVIAADIFGKIKTIVMDITLPLYIFYAFLQTVVSGLAITILGWVCFALLCVCVILTLFSGCNYIIKNRAVLKDN